MKPQLLPALRRLWRAPATVQLGVDPTRAVTLQFDDSRMVKVLDLLDGTRTEAAVASDATLLGMSETQARQILRALREAGLVLEPHTLLPAELPENARRRLEGEASALSLRRWPPGATPADALRRRRAARVLISGRGRMITPIGALLAAAGVGRIELDVQGVVTRADLAPGGLLPEDIGRPRAVAAADAVRRVAPEVEAGPPHGGEPDLAVLVGTPRPAPLTALAHAFRRRPHLTVWLRDGVAVVGPLVRPGQTPCLQCLDLHRRSRDVLWPAIAAQLGTYPDHTEPAEAGVVATGSAVAATHALCHIDGGEPDSVAGAVELSAEPRVRRRSWPPHPQCGCMGSLAQGGGQ